MKEREGEKLRSKELDTEREEGNFACLLANNTKRITALKRNSKKFSRNNTIYVFTTKWATMHPRPHLIKPIQTIVYKMW